MIEVPLSAEALDWACRRIEDFYAVHEGREMPDAIEAVNILRRSLGISDELFNEFHEWAETYGARSVGSLTLGLMIGLIAADRERESGS